MLVRAFSTRAAGQPAVIVLPEFQIKVHHQIGLNQWEEGETKTVQPLLLHHLKAVVVVVFVVVVVVVDDEEVVVSSLQ